MRKNRFKKREAFTLMELLLVMTILVIMGGMVTFAFVRFGRNATMDLALTQIKTYERACMAYKLQHNVFPNELIHLYQAPGGMTERQWRGPFLSDPVKPDPWGNEYTYQKDERNDKVFIRSSGPDGQANTADDIPDPQTGGR